MKNIIGRIAAAIIATVWLVALSAAAMADKAPSNQLTFSNSSGVHRTLTREESFDTSKPFFQDLRMSSRCSTDGISRRPSNARRWRADSGSRKSNQNGWRSA
jgi:hypothetical protein